MNHNRLKLLNLFFGQALRKKSTRPIRSNRFITYRWGAISTERHYRIKSVYFRPLNERFKILFINTNGSMPNRVVQYAKAISGMAPKTIISVSIDGDRETHKTVRGVDADNKAIATIKAVNNLALPNVSAMISTTITSPDTALGSSSCSGIGGNLDATIRSGLRILVQVTTEMMTLSDALLTHKTLWIWKNSFCNINLRIRFFHILSNICGPKQTN